MKLPTALNNLWRRMRSRAAIDDPRLIAAASPYTFYLPSEARLHALEPGDLVKLIFRESPSRGQYDGERMWVEISSISGEDLQGKLDNIPSDLPQLRLGDKIKFKRWQIIDTRWADPDKEELIPPEPSFQRWERCLVDQEVLEGTARVGFLYREEPDMTRDGDTYPDSGWRLRADTGQLTDEQYENPTPLYIAIGKVLNKDDTWLHLVDEPIGSRYIRNFETGEFEPDEAD